MYTDEALSDMPRHSLYIIIGALCVAFLLMLIILIVGICRISRIEYQGSSHHAYQEFYNCRSIDSELSNAVASIRHARSVIGAEVFHSLQQAHFAVLFYNVFVFNQLVNHLWWSEYCKDSK